MRHPTQAGVGLVRMGESDFVPANLEDDLRGKDVYDAEGRDLGRLANHRHPPRPIEEAPQRGRPREVADGEGGEVEPDVARGDAVVAGEHEPVGEEHRM